jgi:kynurenine 3-monooxygenase
VSRGGSEDIKIIGAGLVGSVLSLFLARRGYKVEVLERRPDMRQGHVEGGRSINLAISERGLHALRLLGLEQQVLAQALPMKGRMIHVQDRDQDNEQIFQPYSVDGASHINSVSRGELNKILMTAAESHGVKFSFCKKVTAIDLDRRILTTLDTASIDNTSVQTSLDDPTRKLDFQTLFGCDGSASVLREEIARRAGTVVSESELAHGYKELSMPACDDGFAMRPDALHIWPRGNHMLIALPNVDRTFTCTLFLGRVAFSMLNTKDRVRDYFETYYTDALRLIPDLVEQFFQNPLGRMVTVKSYPWAWHEVALVMGDAAHAIVPFFGQGMNCGFEDCTVFDSLIGDDFTGETGRLPQLGKLFDGFQKIRKPNTDAIADMAVENFSEMCDRVAQKDYQMQKAVEKILQQQFPQEYVSRYSLVSFSRTPYMEAYRIGETQKEILKKLCEGLSDPADVDLRLARILIRAQGLKAERAPVEV